ncbi:MAG: GNAT family N-acetyltransferase [Acidobacteria bacterium]|nr:GNAT family N-acetyltransferase [Acidobacteriota bacterium]
MHDFKYLPISYSDPSTVFSLMEEEEKAWMQDLDWDYSPIRRILASFVRQNLLPGYVAVSGNEAIGYTYFLMNRSKGIIGAVYVRNTEDRQEIADKLLSLTISGLKDTPRIRRVEAQLMPFNGIDIQAIFSRKGFRYFPRRYLSLNLGPGRKSPSSRSPIKIVRLDVSNLSRASEILLQSYLNQTDAVICSDYRTLSGCESYLRSILENPGCGVFVPEVSFMGLEDNNQPCGFVIGCRLSNGVGMIPQIAVHPAYQGKSLGHALMEKALEGFGELGFRRISLTVTPENRKAYDWYVRLGFMESKDFGAFVWER